MYGCISEVSTQNRKSAGRTRTRTWNCLLFLNTYINTLAKTSKSDNICTGVVREYPTPFRRARSEVLALIAPVVGSLVVGLREDELCDSGAGLDFDIVVDFEKSLAFPLVAGVPDGGVEHTGVPQ